MKFLKNVSFAIAVLMVSIYVTTVCVYAAPDKKAPDKKVEQTGYIYLGDSRFVGMNRYVHIDEMENTFVVAKTGEGLSWLRTTAAGKIEEIMESNADIDNWVIITGLGINDYWNAENYIDYYDTMDDVQWILVSVNPVEKDKCAAHGYDYSKLSEGITSFNDQLMETDYQYIDVYTAMMGEGFSTVDGVHYKKETYQFIYDTIKRYLDMQQMEDQTALNRDAHDSFLTSLIFYLLCYIF